MKTAILLIIFSSLFAFTVTGRVQHQAINVGDVLQKIIQCTFDSLEEVTEVNVPTVIVELKEALDNLLICTNVDIQVDGGVLNLIQCAIDEMGNASQEDLAVIFNEIGPIIAQHSFVMYQKNFKNSLWFRSIMSNNFRD
ncbi:hypothetical protein FQA39_LY06075 [Lamprigera yunnana]|nr:hypothetical protein FQA39_LY06075 [Lamprigera yunnana]